MFLTIFVQVSSCAKSLFYFYFKNSCYIKGYSFVHPGSISIDDSSLEGRRGGLIEQLK